MSNKNHTTRDNDPPTPTVEKKTNPTLEAMIEKSPLISRLLLFHIKKNARFFETLNSKKLLKMDLDQPMARMIMIRKFQM